MISHPYAQKFAELSNPGPGKRAKIVRDFMDVTQGALAEQERETDSQIHLQAMLYDRGRVYLSGEKWYNVTGTHIRPHGSFSANIDSPEFSGWWRVGNWSGQLTGYYMARIPGRLVRNGNWPLDRRSLGRADDIPVGAQPAGTQRSSQRLRARRHAVRLRSVSRNVRRRTSARNSRSAIPPVTALQSMMSQPPRLPDDCGTSLGLNHFSTSAIGDSGCVG